MENNFECYIGEPLEKVKKELEEKGYKVLLCENSLPKIKTDYKLVTLVKPVGEKDVMVLFGDFLINIENKIE